MSVCTYCGYRYSLYLCPINNTKNYNKMKAQFKTQLVKLTEKDIAEQFTYLAQYEKLLQREYDYRDLRNEQNIASYKKAIAGIKNLISNPYIEMPIFN